jgi:hypothetical protein
MGECTRREAILTLAGATAATAAAGLTSGVLAGRSMAAEPAPPTAGALRGAGTSTPFDRARMGASVSSPAAARAHAEALAAAARFVAPPPPRGDAVMALAEVHLCRSWDRSLYLYVDERVHGFVATTEEGFALACACQAAGRRVAALLWGCEPAWGGVGRFAGAHLAVDLSDLRGLPAGGEA